MSKYINLKNPLMFVNGRNTLMCIYPASYVNRVNTLEKLYLHLCRKTGSLVEIRKTYYHYAEMWKDDFRSTDMIEKDLSFVEIQKSNHLFDWIQETVPIGVKRDMALIALDLYIRDKEYPSSVMENMKQALLAFGKGEECHNNEYTALVAFYHELWRRRKWEMDRRCDEES